MDATGAKRCLRRRLRQRGFGSPSKDSRAFSPFLRLSRERSSEAGFRARVCTPLLGVEFRLPFASGRFLADFPSFFCGAALSVSLAPFLLFPPPPRSALKVACRCFCVPVFANAARARLERREGGDVCAFPFVFPSDSRGKIRLENVACGCDGRDSSGSLFVAIAHGTYFRGEGVSCPSRLCTAVKSPRFVGFSLSLSLALSGALSCFLLFRETRGSTQTLCVVGGRERGKIHEARQALLARASVWRGPSCCRETCLKKIGGASRCDCGLQSVVAREAGTGAAGCWRAREDSLSSRNCLFLLGAAGAVRSLCVTDCVSARALLSKEKAPSQTQFRPLPASVPCVCSGLAPASLGQLKVCGVASFFSSHVRV